MQLLSPSEVTPDRLARQLGAVVSSRSSGGGASNRAGGAEPLVDRLPVNVAEERLDVLPALGELVVQREGVLPDVHHQQRLEARRMSILVQGDPVVAKAVGD